jgi:membrane associated rhomboid family serine protease
MGIYDRDYLRDDERPSGWAARSMVINLIIVNAAVFLVNFVSEDRINPWLELDSRLFQKPWECWKLLTYGFAHADFLHILLNMYFLWLFGNELEGIYGRTEFLRIYLVAIVFSGLIWAGITAVSEPDKLVTVVGASGGVMAIMMLYVLHFPRRVLLIWGLIPIPAWALGGLYVLFDLAHAFQPRAGGDEPQVANVAHLAGAAFGFVYFRSKVNLGRFVPRRLSDLKGSLLKPKLRIHDPDREAEDLTRQVDRILEKISREGEASLTKKERQTLEEASRRYQRRRQ